jgi:hypothetical protein
MVESGLCTRAPVDPMASNSSGARAQLTMHNYTDYQPSAATVRAAREDATRRKQLSRLKKLGAESQCDVVDPGSAGHTPVTAPRTRDPHPHPIPSRKISISSDSPSASPDTSELAQQSSGAEPSNAAAVRAVFECWQLEHGKQRSKLDRARRARIKARLSDHFTVEQLCQAIRGAKKDSYLMGRDPKASRAFDGLETILRDASMVERLIALDEGAALNGSSTQEGPWLSIGTHVL